MHRSTIAGALCALLTASSITSVADAHVTLETREASPNSTYKAVLRIPHGCDGEATHTVSVELPEGFINAKPMPKPGWRLTTRSGAYDRTYDYHGRAVAEGVKEITWEGGSLPDAFYDEFVFRGHIADLPPGTRLHFRTTQTCLNVEAAWTEIAVEGQDPHALRHPAPELLVVAEAGDEGHRGSHAAHGAGAAPGTASVGPITIKNAFARPSFGKAPNSAVYMTIETTKGPDRLVEVASPAAESAEMHTSSMDDRGVMRMRPVEAVLVEPGEPARLETGGPHVMLMGLKAPLEEGTTIRLTLTFEKAGEVTFDVPVGSPSDALSPDHGEHGRRHAN